MKLFNTVIELQNYLQIGHEHPLGFVPTMGALHEGHLSLIRTAIQQCRVVVVSIFVNPTQFNDQNDLQNYPRTPEKDIELLEKAMRETDIAFTPGVKEIYPEDDTREFHFGNLDNVMEALHRPGHFKGVAQVVSKLFDIVKPDIAIFGLKDLQQFAVIKSLVRQTGRKVKIIGHPIIRENDGLAMSSRNMLLDKELRKRAGIIYKTIKGASALIRKSDIPEIKSSVRESINNEPGFNVEYFEIVDEEEMVPLETKEDLKEGRSYYGCIAVKAGNIRLIDNIEIGLV